MNAFDLTKEDCKKIIKDYKEKFKSDEEFAKYYKISVTEIPYYLIACMFVIKY